LLCPIHHKIIDDDPGSYTVERLTRLKETHASNSVATSDVKSESAAQALVAHSIASISQSGGITAHTVHQVFNLQPPPASIADDRRRGEAKRYLAPELQRTIERIHYIHGRAIANFLCHSADKAAKPTDQKKDFIPHWPILYPTAPQFRELEGDDAAALVEFYDSLHALANHVNDWWEREGQLPVNLFNSLLHDASKSLKLALACIERFGLEVLFPPPYEAWGTISDRIRQSLKHEEDVRKHHLARCEARSAKAKTSQLPTT